MQCRLYPPVNLFVACKRDIQKVRSLKIPEFWLPSPLVCPCSFSRTPLKVRSFWLDLPLSPPISTLVNFREKKLMSTSIFGWTQRVF